MLNVQLNWDWIPEQQNLTKYVSKVLSSQSSQKCRVPSASVPSKTRVASADLRVAPATAEPEFYRSRFDGKYEVHHRSLKSFRARVIVIVARGLDRSEEYCSSMHLKRQNLKTLVVEKFLQTVPHRHSDTWPIICTVINLLVGSLGSCIVVQRKDEGNDGLTRKSQREQQIVAVVRHAALENRMTAAAAAVTGGGK